MALLKQVTTLANAIMLGYERAVLDAFDDDPDTFLKEFKEYSNQLSKYPAYPSDLIDWFNSILYPSKDDPFLYDLPWDREYTKFKMPSSSFYLTPAPHFQCLGYPIEVCNVHDSSRILTFFAEAYQFLPASLLEDYGLPDMDQAPELKITPSSLITLEIISWANMVRQSFAFAFQSTATPTMRSTYAIRELVFKVLHNEHDYLVDQFSTLFLEAVEYSALTSLFSRHWNNKGNSMESLALLMAEAGYHSLIIVMSWLVMQLQYRDSSYPWKAEYLAP